MWRRDAGQKKKGDEMQDEKKMLRRDKMGRQDVRQKKWGDEMQDKQKWGDKMRDKKNGKPRRKMK